MNLDFSNQPMFSWYVVLLLLSGIAMVGFGLVGSGLSKGMRAVNLVFGVGFVGYGIYLAFIFQGGTYFIFFKAFILPVALIVRSIAAMNGKRRQAAAQPMVQAQQAAYQQGAYQQGAYQQPFAQQGVPAQPQDANPYQQGAQAQPNPYQQAPAAAPYDPNR
ncbi:hypothetical protein [Kitasatospora viridis]|uniref:Uncharacterized protein n=1 Tax=Kitasatospora viridis TaxID=281105 RepID=A0A561UH66_9ACTN|nr:hypothetical protein [Kitasatospora viridis]TWF98701.1 hypothetical protein FHX73_112522 [Kitasatospora viridis]